MSSIETRAVIENGAAIGEGTTVGERSFIGKNVKIGKNNTIAPMVVIEGNTTIGDNNSIGSNTVLGSAPQDIKTTTDSVELRIGDGNCIGKYVFMTAGTEHGGGTTKIGNKNIFEDGVHIGHDVHLGSGCILENNAALGGHVVVGDHVKLGKNSSVHQFVHIGSFAKLEEEGVLTQDLPPYCMAEGNRAKISGLNSDGIKKHFDKSLLECIKKAFLAVFDGTSPKDNAKKELNKNRPKECSDLYSFILDSKRGIPFKRNINVKQKV